METTPQQGQVRELEAPAPGSPEKRVREVYAVEQLVEMLDYSSLEGIEELNACNRTMYPDEQVAEAKQTGLALVDEYDVYDVVDKASTDWSKVVDTTWASSMGPDGILKMRVVGRDYKKSSVREDVFAPMSSPMMTRVVDYLAMKDDDDPNDELVTFIGDCCSAYYQTPATEIMYVHPPEEWKIARRLAGLSSDVMWLLKKQLPGQRAAGARWVDFFAAQCMDCGLERYEAMPHFFRKPYTRLVVESHMDDFHGTARRSEATVFLEEIRKRLKLKASELCVVGAYAHLRKTRMKLENGTHIAPNAKHARNVINALGLAEANACKTPDLPDAEPPNSPALVGDERVLYRSCTMSLMYASQDLVNIQRQVNFLSTCLNAPTEHNMLQLKRVARYLIGVPDLGVWLPKPDPSRFSKGVVELEGECDTDWGADKKDRKSLACGLVFADHCQLASFVRKQGFLAQSSGEAEFGGIHTIVLELKCFKNFFEWLGFLVRWRAGTDSSAAKSMAQRAGVGRVRHMDIRLLYTQQQVKECGLRVHKVEGVKNRADIGTKAHTGTKLAEKCKMAGLVRASDFEQPRALEVSNVNLVRRETTPSVRAALVTLLAALVAEGAGGHDI